jgi:hypothetical protein
MGAYACLAFPIARVHLLSLLAGLAYHLHAIMQGSDTLLPLNIQAPVRFGGHLSPKT